MTAAHEDRAPVHLTRRLSVLPAVVGLLGVVWALVGAWAAGLGDGPRGGVLTAGVAALVLATVVTGSGAGLYAGLALLVVAALAGGDGDVTRGELIALVVATIVIHETVRFSLEARRPSRLGPGLVASYLVRVVVVSAASAAIVVGLWALADRTPDGAGWIPIGMAVAGLPPLTLWATRRLGPERLPRPEVRLVAAVAITVAVLAVAAVGARARSGIESGGATETETTTTTTTVVEAVVVEGVADPIEFRRGLTFLFLIGITLILGALYLALRRPEAWFDLDELAQDTGEHTFGLAPPGRADTRSDVEVDDDELARLLAELRLDIEAEADPARAVRYAYANVERRLADLGLPHRPEETEREYLARALSQVDGRAALTELTALFEQARFGTEPVDEAMRNRALAAIADLETRLAAPTPSGVTVAEPGATNGAGAIDGEPGRVADRDDHPTDPTGSSDPTGDPEQGDA